MIDSKRPQVRESTINDEQGGQRVDNYLLKCLKGVPKSRVYRLLRKGEVRVNGRRIKPEYRLEPGDRVRIPPVRTAEARPSDPNRSLVERVEASILYEDDRLIVLNKPSGIAVHGGSGVSYGVIEALRASRPTARFLELAHRLDRDTSGCLVVAKRRSALRAFQEQLRGTGIEKRYLALLKGSWRGGVRRVDAPLRKNVLRSGERMVNVDPEGKPALSLFRPVTIYKAATLVEVTLLTGRTHQIRVHARHLGQPIAGDAKYGDEAFNRFMAERGLKRLFLHAHQLGFTLDEASTTLRIEAPLDPALSAVLNQLENEHAA